MQEMIDNKTGVPLAHYLAQFAAADPQSMSARSGVPFDGAAFHTTLLGREVRISYPDMAMTFADTGAELQPNARILLGRLLTEGTLAEGSGRFKSYAEMPWGNVYLTQFTGRCITRLAYGFSDPVKFAAACEAQGGVRVRSSGECFDLLFLPTLTMRLTVWPAEEDFPPSAQILFSDNFPLAFTAEDMAVCGDVLLNAMKGRL